MNSTRQAVLDNIRRLGQATVSQLANQVEVKAVTVRHHLNALQAEGLIQVEEQRQPVGRPVHVFSLTEKGQGLYPQNYHVLVARLLDQMKEQLPSHMVNALINSLADSLAEDLRGDLAGLSSAQRLDRTIDVLAEKGFMARWRTDGDGLQLLEYHCPYYLVGQQHPEICQIDEVLIRVAVNNDIVKSACLLFGDQVCTFEVQT
ncbi:MAG: helix-turn-helix domain-containing protein [Chloroflexi bacterium]|nr:helix-turn-helix domain-containing protein [Chloroflexota bacterium]